jgi:hypothetical protein
LICSSRATTSEPCELSGDRDLVLSVECWAIEQAERSLALLVSRSPPTPSLE